MKGSSLQNVLWRYKSQVLAAISWIVVGLSANWYMRMNNLTPIEFADEMSHLLADNWYGPLLYIVAYFLRPFTFFPGTPMTMLAGYVYGVWWGFVYAMIAGLISTVIPYATGRWFSDESRLRETLSERNTTTVRLVRMMRDNPFQTVLTTRFLYLPYDLVNFLAGSLHIPFLSFILATALGNIINVFIMANIGASLEASLSEGEFTVDPNLIILSVVVWLLSYGITRYLKRHNKETIVA